MATVEVEDRVVEVEDRVVEVEDRVVEVGRPANRIYVYIRVFWDWRRLGWVSRSVKMVPCVGKIIVSKRVKKLAGLRPASFARKRSTPGAIPLRGIAPSPNALRLLWPAPKHYSNTALDRMKH